jgi:hypothetical protein
MEDILDKDDFNEKNEITNFREIHTGIISRGILYNCR